MIRNRRLIGSLAFMLWIAGLFFLQGVLFEDPVTQSFVARLNPSGRLTQILVPLFTATYQQ
jgi:hypothetical protein